MSEIVIPGDLLLKIFYLIDDYKTLKNMFLINKPFYNDYIKSYKNPHKHMFNCISKELFEFLYKCPNLSETEIDLQLQTNLRYTELLTVYNIYKQFIYNEMERYFGKRYAQNNSKSLTSIILIQGYTYINNNIEVDFNIEYNPKLNVVLKPRFGNTIINTFNTSCPFIFLKQRLSLFEELIVRHNELQLQLLQQ
jgi:hypothetical protein